MDLRKNQHLSHLKFTLPRFANRELSLRPFCAPTACALLAWCRAIVTMKYVMCGRAPCLRVSNASGVNHGAGLSATQLPRPPPVPAPDAQPNVARHDVLWVQRNPEQGRNRRPRPVRTAASQIQATSGSRGKSASKSASKVCFAGRAVYQPANSQLWRTACAIAYGPLGDNQKPVWWKIIPERPVGDFVEPRCVAQACGTCGAFFG